MKGWRAVLCVLVALVACADDERDGGGVDGGIDQGIDEGEVDEGVDLGCFSGADLAWQYSTLVTVEDSTTLQAITDPSFHNGAATLEAHCFSTDPNADLAGSCTGSWSVNDHVQDIELTVKAPGHVDKIVSVKHSILVGGCLGEVQVTLDVKLDPP